MAMQKSVGAVRWWMRRRPVFVATLAMVASAIVLAGWLTGLRDVFHGAAVSIAVVAFLPFIVIAIGLSLLASCVVIASVADVDPPAEGAAEVMGLGTRMIGPYYRTLDRLRRHPIVWGVCSGAVLGCAVLGLAIAVVVLPAEMDTADRLADTQARIEEHYAKRGSYPRPGANGELVLDGEVVRDAFGNTLDYRVSGHWKVASYRLSSRGYDGDGGTVDDLCVHGATALAGVVDKLSSATELLSELRTKRASRSTRLASTRALRCN